MQFVRGEHEWSIEISGVVLVVIRDGARSTRRFLTTDQAQKAILPTLDSARPLAEAALLHACPTKAGAA